jgi:hypothetical protein
MSIPVWFSPHRRAVGQDFTLSCVTGFECRLLGGIANPRTGIAASEVHDDGLARFVRGVWSSVVNHGFVEKNHVSRLDIIENMLSG